MTCHYHRWQAETADSLNFKTCIGVAKLSAPKFGSRPHMSYFQYSSV